LKKVWTVPTNIPSFLANHDIGILVQELSEHTADVHVQNDVLDGMFTFYDATKATLNVYQVYLKIKCTSFLAYVDVQSHF
jgi:hypothetical protein